MFPQNSSNHKPVIMTLLASQIPLLYCLMYFQSNRRSSLNQSSNNLLLNAITSQRRLASLSRRSPSHTSRTRDSSKELFEHEKPLSTRNRDWAGRSTVSDLEERSWVRHQDTDLRQLCLERYSDSPQTSRSTNKPKNNVQTNGDCSRRQQSEVRQIMSERFMTVKELQTLLPEVTKHRQPEASRPTTRRYKAETLPYANLKAAGDNHCDSCNTEIGYEVMSHIQDFKGNNYTVINFEDAYQFIPAGRCINENSPCGGGGSARCVQIYRAQWTLVWSSSSGGTRLVAHEVPSHCQCINLGSPIAEAVKGPLIKTPDTVQTGVVSTDTHNAGASIPSH